jgi:amidase
VLTRSVRDSAAMLDATHGPEIGSMYRIEPPARPYLEEVTRELGPLRIGFTQKSPIGTEVHPEAVIAVQKAAQLLASLGHHVEEAEPAVNGMQLAQDFVVMWFANCAATVDIIKQQTGCGDEGFELDTLAMVAFGRASRASDYVAGYMRWNDYTRQLGEFHQKYDLFMTPTMAMPPARVGQIATPGWQQVAIRILMALRLSGLLLKGGFIEDMVRENLRWVPFTQIGNLTGAPGMSVPLHWTADGLPLGTHFIAPHGGEGTLFQLAGQLERAQPWKDRRPPL